MRKGPGDHCTIRQCNEILSLDDQLAIEQAAQHAHLGNEFMAEWWRGLAGYGGIDEYSTSSD